MTTFRPTVSRRNLLLAAAGVPALLYLPGCSTSSDDGNGGGKPSKLSLSDWWGQQFANFLPIMEAKTSIAIDHQLYSYAPEKIFTQLASGTAPVMFLADASWNGDLFPHGDKLLAAFNDKLTSSSLDMKKWNVDPYKETAFGGKVLALSVMTTQDNIVMVNKELAEKSGLLTDAPVWGSKGFDTWKWDTFVEWLKEGTKTRRDGTVEQYGLGAVPGASQLYPTILADLGGTLFDNDWNYDETKSMLDQEPAIAAAQTIADLYNKHKVAAPTGTEEAIRGGTYLGRKAMATIQWSTPSAYPEDQNFPTAYFHLPYTQNKVHASGANQLSVNSKCKYIDAALDWVITFCTDTDVRTKFLEVSSVPAYDPLPIVNAAPEGTPKTIALINLSRIEGMSTVPENTAGVKLYPRWFGRYASTFTITTIQAALDQVILGKATAKDAFTDAKQQIDKKIAEGRLAATK